MFEYDVSLNHNHGDISIAMKTLKGQQILVDNGVECITSVTIIDVHYGDAVRERWFTIINSDGVSMLQKLEFLLHRFAV